MFSPPVFLEKKGTWGRGAQLPYTGTAASLMSGRTRAPAHHRRHHARQRNDTRNPHTTYVTSFVVLATSHVSVRTAASGCLRPHSFTDAPPPSLATASLAAATGLLFVVIRQRALLLHQGDDVGDERRKRQVHHLAPAPLRDPIRRLDRVCYHNLHVTVGGRWVGVDDTHGGGVRGGAWGFRYQTV